MEMSKTMVHSVEWKKCTGKISALGHKKPLYCNCHILCALSTQDSDMASLPIVKGEEHPELWTDLDLQKISLGERKFGEIGESTRIK